jgi:hypothetical protein
MSDKVNILSLVALDNANHNMYTIPMYLVNILTVKLVFRFD